MALFLTSTSSVTDRFASFAHLRCTRLRHDISSVVPHSIPHQGFPPRTTYETSAYHLFPSVFRLRLHRLREQCASWSAEGGSAERRSEQQGAPGQEKGQRQSA